MIKCTFSSISYLNLPMLKQTPTQNLLKTLVKDGKLGHMVNSYQTFLNRSRWSYQYISDLK